MGCPASSTSDRYASFWTAAEMLRFFGAEAAAEVTGTVIGTLLDSEIQRKSVG